MHLADTGGMQWSRLVGSVWVCCGLMFVVIGLCWVRFGFSVSGSLGIMRCYVPYVFGSGYLRRLFYFGLCGLDLAILAQVPLFLDLHVSIRTLG